MQNAAELAWVRQLMERKQLRIGRISLSVRLAHPKEVLYAPLQSYFHALPRLRSTVAFERGPGAVSTHKSRFESGRWGKVHRSTASKRLGPRPQLDQPILGERSGFGLVNTLHWHRSQGRLGGPRSLGKRRRSWSTDRNCDQRVAGHFGISGDGADNRV